MKKKIVFLSRVSGEFSELTDAIREEGLRAYPMLQICDQKNPPGGSMETAAELTVSKIHEWISLSSHVFQYVGREAGYSAEVPATEMTQLRQLLDPVSQHILEGLLESFRSEGVEASELTYTQVEAVIAMALKKNPLILLLEPLADRMQPALKAYRDWLMNRYLPGRDRIASGNKHDLVVATHRKLGELNDQTAMEALVRSVAEEPLWDTVLTWSQPFNTTDRDIERASRDIRHYVHSIAIDWIDARVDCGTCPGPPYLGKGLAREQDGFTRNWLIPFDDETGVLSNRSGHWDYRILSVRGRSLCASCFHEGSFWVLTRGEKGRYSLRCLGPVHDGIETEVHGFATHNIEPIQLGHSEQGFQLSCAGSHWCLAEPAAPGQPYKALSFPAPVGSLDMVVPQFPKQAAFPFRRYFGGATYESNHSQPKWALVNCKGRISHITLRPGLFTDAFRTVDLTVEGLWNAFEVSGHSGIVSLFIRSNDMDKTEAIPLFPALGPVSWKKFASRLPLLTQDFGEQLYEIRPLHAAQFAPFCFLNRKVTGTPNQETRFQVWLIPARFSRDLMGGLKPFLCDLEPLPVSPICGVLPAGIRPEFHSPWWQLLWEQCQRTSEA